MLYFRFLGEVYFFFLVAVFRLESSFFLSGRAAVTEHYLLFGSKGSFVKCDIEQSRTRQPLLQNGYLCLYLTSPFGNFAGNRSVINFREAVAAREKAETAEEIQHLLATFTERGEVSNE